MYLLCFYVKITATKSFTSFIWPHEDIEIIQEYSYHVPTLVNSVQSELTLVQKKSN